jgi:hypothetical protein
VFHGEVCLLFFLTCSRGCHCVLMVLQPREFSVQSSAFYDVQEYLCGKMGNKVRELPRSHTQEKKKAVCCACVRRYCSHAHVNQEKKETKCFQERQLSCREKRLCARNSECIGVLSIERWQKETWVNITVEQRAAREGWKRHEVLL